MNNWDGFKIAHIWQRDAILELKAGKSKSLDVVYSSSNHWLGSSSISLRYAIPNLKSAKMYLT